MAAPQINKKYTYADYLTWDDGRRWELIGGIPYELVYGDGPHNMSPAPKRRHQRISGNLFFALKEFTKDDGCEVFAAPFDVRFQSDLDHNVQNIVQPDISVFCDESLLDDRGAHGAPDLIVEILSESNLQHDLTTKLLLYQNNGVREYWIVDPAKEVVIVNIPGVDGKYIPAIEQSEGEIQSRRLKGFSIAITEIFA